MYYQSGNMRDIINEHSPYKNSQCWQRQKEFQYAQRSKYQKSQSSYLINQKSRVIFNQDKTDRMAKQNQSSHTSKNEGQVTVTLPIKIKCTDREDYKASFNIQLITLLEKGSSCLTMHITNDVDSLFLWSFFLREPEFLNLKNQQSLKVDFHGFPEVIIEHLNYCSNQEKQSKNPIFYAVLDIKKGNQQAELKIIQANKYKQSLHLSLKFKKANDQQQKIYLANKFDRQRKENAILNGKLTQAQHNLNIRMRELEELHAQFKQVSREKDERIEELERRERQKIKETVLRYEEQNMRKQKEESEKNTRIQNQLTTKLDQQKQKNDQLFQSYQKSAQKIISLQSTQSTLRSKCSILEQQVQSYEKINRQQKQREIKSNQEFHILKNQNTRLSCMVQSLEDKIRDRDHRISQNTQAKSNNFNQISALEDGIRQEKAKLVKVQQKNEMLEAQISKMHKKYEDLANKYHKKKDKFNDYKEILTLQENKIQGYEKQQRRTLEEIVQFKRQLEKSQLEIRDKDIKIKDLKGQMEKNLQLIEEQKKIMSDLNKRINEKTIGAKILPIPSSLPVYTGTTASLGRDFSAYSSTSQSRIKYSPSPSPVNVMAQKTSQRIAPPFRKYREGVENDKDQQNSYKSHSRSPIINKLSQQTDPQDVDRTKQKIGPIKFKREI